MGQMKGNPTVKVVESTKPVKVYKSHPIIDPTIVSKIQDHLDSSSLYEVEVGFGTFRRPDGSFMPGVLSPVQFADIMNRLKEIAVPVMYNDKTESMEKLHARKITDHATGNIIWQKKFRPREANIDNDVWGYRVSKSTEEIIDEPTDTFIPDIVRHRKRFSFVINDESSDIYGFKFDLSHVKEVKIKEDGEEFSIIKYEVEIERVNALIGYANIDHLENAIRLVLESINFTLNENMLMTLDERIDATAAHNSLFHNDMAKTKFKSKSPYKLYKDYWNKPVNIRVDDLLETRLNDTSITVKYDGVRRFMLVTASAIYAYGPPDDVWKIGEGMVGSENTLFDAELCNTLDGTDIYFIFDILFHKGIDVRQLNFQERLRLIENFGTINLDNANVKVKTFFTKGTFYEKAQQAIDSVDISEMGVNVDGLIFQPSHWYKNNHTKKWKPADQMTIDFVLRKIGDEDTEYELWVGEEKRGESRFKGTKRNPYNKTIIVPDGTYDGIDPDGMIFECLWDPTEENFTIYRWRNDRDRPNAHKTALDVWDDIMNPIPIETIKGQNLQVMRRYHNIIKETMLKSEFRKDDIIMDWGSGRGGDLNKWANIGLKKVFVVEPNETNLEELKRRYAEIKKKLDITIATDDDGNLLGGEDTDGLAEVIDGTPIDGIVSFFSLTFFGKDEARWDAMIDSFDKLIPPGGKLVGIVMDGIKVRSLMSEERSKQSLDEGEAVDLTNPSFSISQITEFTDDPTGNEIEIKIHEESSMVRGEDEAGQTEWLFYFEKFRAQLESRGFAMISGGFIIRDPTAKHSSFDVLPPDSKLWSSLNRSFVFVKKEVQPEYYINVPLADDEMVPFENIYGQEMVRIGISRDVSSFVRSIVRAFDTKYFELSSQERTKRIAKIRQMIGRKIDRSMYDTVNNGLLARGYKNKVLSEMHLKQRDPVLADEIGFLEYKLKVIDPTEYIGYDGVMEVISKLLDINIIVLGSNSLPRVKQYGNQDRTYVKEQLMTHPKTILLFTNDDLHYDLVGKKDDDQPYTMFATADKLIEDIIGKL